MASKILESRCEIEGAKRLISVAQKWNKSAAAMRAVAREEWKGSSSNYTAAALTILMFAKSQLLESEIEVKNAEAYLNEIEKRWEVIDVDGGSDPSSTATDATQNSNDDNMVILSDSGDDEISNGSAENVVSVTGDVEGATSISTSTNGSNVASKVKNEAEQIILEVSDDEDVPYHVTVEGCGVRDINGTFTLAGFHDDAPRYSKTVESGYTHSSSNTIHYTIQRDTTTPAYEEVVKKWLILGSCPGGIKCHYFARDDNTSKLPPLNRWKVAQGVIRVQGGNYNTSKRLPSPTLSHEPKIARANDEDYYNDEGEIVNELLVEGCGTEEINGIYRKNGNGGSSYFKTRSSDGLPCANIYRGKSCYQSGHYTWYISVLEKGQWLDYYVTSHIQGLPLTDSWQRKYGRGSRKTPLVKLNPGRNTQGQGQVPSRSGTKRKTPASSVNSNLASAKKTNDAGLVEQTEWEVAFNRHRYDTYRLLEASAARGEASVPTTAMTMTRKKNLVALKAGNLLAHQMGGKKLSDNEIMTQIVCAEQGAVTLYIQDQKQKSSTP